MAKANPIFDSFKKYLKTDFAYKRDWDSTEVLGESFTYEEVKKAVARLKYTDPSLHKVAAYFWLTDRHRSDISNSLFLDSSTCKRRFDKAATIIINWLVNAEACPVELEPLDLLYQEEYSSRRHEFLNAA